MSDTPRTDKEAFDITTGVEDIDGVVMADFARELERENAALRGALEQAEDALRHALIMSPLDPFQRGKVISAAIDVARAALNAARREGTP